ncbi:MAG: flagellin, partial [Lachnospiraceae bacterium]|nr:flagellin [Lachnospiraceae bacterium]
MNVITNNIPGMFSQRQLGITNANKAKSTEKLASGYKINRAADDAAGLTISEKMRFYIRGLDQGSKNIQDGVSLCQVSDGALNEVHDMLHRLNELAVHGANDTLNDEDREALDSETKAIKEEMRRVFNTTSFNEDNVFVPPYSLDVSGMPNDFQVYNLDLGENSGSSKAGIKDLRYGGLEIDNVRYTWNELGLDQYLSADGRSWENIPYNAELGGNIIDVNLSEVRKNDPQYRPEDEETVILRVTQGEDLPMLERVYTWEADDDGIKINNVRAKTWAELEVTDSGKSDGMLKFSHNGVDYSLNTGKDNKNDIITRINNYHLDSDEIFTAGLSDVPVKQAVDYEFDFKFNVTNSNKNIMDDDYKILANDRGIQISFGSEGDRDRDSLSVSHTLIKWEDFTNKNSGEPFKIQDFGINNKDNRPVADNQTFSENAVYSYKDEATGLEFDFTIRDESSRDAIIKAINNDITEKYTVPGYAYTSGNGAGDRISINSNTIVNRGVYSLQMQKELGRDFSSSETLNFEIKKSINISSSPVIDEVLPDIHMDYPAGSELKAQEPQPNVTSMADCDLSANSYVIYNRTRNNSTVKITDITDRKNGSLEFNFDYSGKYGKTNENLDVTDGDTHKIKYYEQNKTTKEYEFYEDTYTKFGTVEKNGDQWVLKNVNGDIVNDDYTIDPSSGLYMTTDEINISGKKYYQMGDMVSGSEDNVKTRTIINPNERVYDDIDVKLDYN